MWCFLEARDLHEGQLVMRFSRAGGWVNTSGTVICQCQGEKSGRSVTMMQGSVPQAGLRLVICFLASVSKWLMGDKCAQRQY